MSATITFIHNNQRYVVPNLYIPNSLKFEMIRDIIFKYNYTEFVNNFDVIYNNLNIEHQHICYWIHFISEEYMRLKNENDWIPEFEFGDIIATIQNETISVYRRKNNKHFHIDFIPMICCWIKYKNNDNFWITNDDSYEIIHQLKGYDYYWSLKQKLDRFLSHFDL